MSMVHIMCSLNRVTAGAQKAILDHSLVICMCSTHSCVSHLNRSRPDPKAFLEACEEQLRVYQTYKLAFEAKKVSAVELVFRETFGYGLPETVRYRADIKVSW